MTHVSRRKLPPKTKSDFTNLLTHCLTSLNKKGVLDVLNTLLTDTEIQMVEKRLMIILLIKSNLTIKDISEMTKTTPQTVERIKNKLLLMPAGVRNEIDKKIGVWARTKFVKNLINTLLNTENRGKRVLPYPKY